MSDKQKGITALVGAFAMIIFFTGWAIADENAEAAGTTYDIFDILAECYVGLTIIGIFSVFIALLVYGISKLVDSL